MDQALRRGVTRDEFAALIEGASRRAGVETLRQVVAFADGRAASAAESVSRVTMARAKIDWPSGKSAPRWRTCVDISANIRVDAILFAAARR